MRRLPLTLLAILFLSMPVWGQTPSPPADQAEVIKTLLARIDKLEQRVNDLEGKLACPSPPCAPEAHVLLASMGEPPAIPSAPAPKPAPKPQQDQHGMPVGEQQSPFPTMQIRGFGDVDFGASNEPATTLGSSSASNSGFTLGQFVLHISSPLTTKVNYFGELSFTAQPSSPFTLEVERMLLRYDYNDMFKISFGKYHTPINYWNTAFHHGLWLQTTIARPEMIKFGGPFQPVHFIGLLGEGAVPTGALGLNYQVGVGNGRSTNIARAGDAGDINNNRAWVMNIFSRPRGWSGFQIGGSAYGDEITVEGLHRTRELISSGHIVWTRETPEVLAEFANVRHLDTQTGQSFNSQAYYAQVAYRLPILQKKWKPYYRFEHTRVPAGEPIFDVPLVAPTFVVPDLVQSTAGIRFDFSDFAAFKGEYRNTRRGAGEPSFHGAFFQTSFTF